MFKPAEVPNWIVVIYERVQRFNDETTRRMITSLVRGCEAVGTITQGSPTATSRTELR